MLAPAALIDRTVIAEGTVEGATPRGLVRLQNSGAIGLGFDIVVQVDAVEVYLEPVDIFGSSH